MPSPGKLAVAAWLAASSSAFGATYVDLTSGGNVSGLVANYQINCLATTACFKAGSFAIMDATSATASDAISSKAFATGGGNGSFSNADVIRVADIPVGHVIGVGAAFRFAFDQIEPGGQRAVDLTRISISIDKTLIWEFDAAIANVAPIRTNSGKPGFADTHSPTAAGADFAIYIPVATVMAAGAFTGSSSLSLSWTQADTRGQAERWVFVGFKDDTFFDLDDPIEVVPLPAAASLLLAALATIGLAARRRPA